MSGYAPNRLINTVFFASLTTLLAFVILISIVGQQATAFASTTTTSSSGDRVDDVRSIASDKSSFKINVTLLDNPSRSLDHVKFYIQEHPNYHDTMELNDAFSPDDGTYFPKVTFTLEIPQGIVADRETFHLCVATDDNGQTKACYNMVKHEGKDKESLTIDTGKL